MTAEALTDERLADLITEYAPDFPDDHPILAALRELQAYRAKREIHVWVPREPTPAMVEAAHKVWRDHEIRRIGRAIEGELTYMGWAEAYYRAMISASETVLAASDGNPP